MDEIVEISGFKFPFLRYIPTCLDKSKNIHILLWCHGTYDISNFVELKQHILRELAGYKSIASDTNTIIVMPVIPKTANFDAQILEKTVLFDNTCPSLFYRPDLEIVKFIQNEIKDLKEEGLDVEDKIYGVGDSAGANLVNRLSTMYSNVFSKVVLLSAGSFMYPQATIRNLKLPYPLGLYDLDQLGIVFNIDYYEKVKQFVFVGELDTNPGPIEYELRGFSELLSKAKKLFGETSLKRTKHYVDFLQSENIITCFELGKNMGHELNGEVVEKMINFLNQ